MASIRVALDAMGGDHGPEVVKEGALLALRDHGDLEILLVGDPSHLGQDQDRLKIIASHEVVTMEDSPVEAARRKPGSSMAIAMDLVKQNEAQAIISVGNTGALMATALLRLGRIPGVERPAIASVLPARMGPCLLLDSGANMDCKASYLQQFALLGATYVRLVLGIENPKVGLLNIGAEPHKGNHLARETYDLLTADSRINFQGNVEGGDLLEGTCQVVVTDGFAGNVALKAMEGCSKTLQEAIKSEIQSMGLRGILGGWLLKDAFKQLTTRFDPSAYGGAPLLGLQGICIAAHGSSRAPSIRNAIRVAVETVQNHAMEHVMREISQWA
jgi:glycerol-3-phosphate acyltransferase PlsX